MDVTTIILIISAIGNLGGIGAIVALVKLRPEAGQIIVTSAQGAVIVQSGVIKDLKAELERISNELEEERQASLDERTTSQKLRETLRQELDNEKIENEKLRVKLSEFEKKLQELTIRTSSIEQNKNE